MKLSKNFTESEFNRSQTAARLGIENKMNTQQSARAGMLCRSILQPLRNKVGKPINISSGFRSQELNKAIKGSPTSQHCKGEAADFTIPGMSVPEVCELIIKMDLPFHQLIDEFSQKGQGWIHVSIAHEGHEPRRQYLTARRDSDGNTVYTEISRG